MQCQPPTGPLIPDLLFNFKEIDSFASFFCFPEAAKRRRPAATAAPCAAHDGEL